MNRLLKCCGPDFTFSQKFPLHYCLKKIISNFKCIFKENDLKWQSESENLDVIYDKRSISSEGSSNAVFSEEANEIFSWQQQHQTIWDSKEIEDSLLALPNAVLIYEMVKKGCFEDLQLDDANLALIFASIYGTVENVYVCIAIYIKIIKI